MSDGRRLLTPLEGRSSLAMVYRYTNPDGFPREIWADCQFRLTPSQIVVVSGVVRNDDNRREFLCPVPQRFQRTTGNRIPNHPGWQLAPGWRDDIRATDAADRGIPR